MLVHHCKYQRAAFILVVAEKKDPLKHANNTVVLVCLLINSNKNTFIWCRH